MILIQFTIDYIIMNQKIRVFKNIIANHANLMALNNSFNDL
jgi:hypothetical protein